MTYAAVNRMMEESVDPNIADGEIINIQFGLATHNEIRKSSISDCPISHASQLANPFLGLPLEIGKCESCGTAEVGKCEGHFGYIELPIPVYHPSHICELRRVLSLLCLKCLKLKTSKPVKNIGVLEKLLTSCCEETCHVSIKESKNNDGASFLELRLPARYKAQKGSWNFLEKYGYRYGDGTSRTLLPTEVSTILRKLPDETRRKLAKKGYFPQDGYILRYLPVPPNCLSVPDVSDGVSVMSSDLSASMLKKVLRQIDVIRSSRSGEPNFESHEVEANELQVAVLQYLQVRGTGKAARDADNRYGVTKEGNNSSTKAWLEKMRTLFISKGSGFSSRSVITGDAYKPVNEVGLPFEIAHKMTFEERVNVHNIQFLQSLVDKNLCLTFKDGMSTYSLREGSKGHTFLRLGQIVHRRIMDGDIVFINRPPTTHKHSLQALRVYIHDGHTVKINPLMCGPLAADFDGDCVHLFYPQSLSARAEVVELFSVENQLLSSHSGNLNLQLATDSLLSLKTLFQGYFLDKPSTQQLAMFSSSPLPAPAVRKACSFGPRWTALQVLQTALPPEFECHGERLLIRGSEIIKFDFSRESISLMINEILTDLFFNKSSKEALNFFDSLQPLLMENLFAEGFSVGLDDFYVPITELQLLQSQIQDTSTLLMQLRSSFNELIQLQFQSFIKQLKLPVGDFILKSSALGNLIDSKSDSAVDKIVQQIGFLGLQLSDKRKFYSKGLVEEVASLFHQKYPFVGQYPSQEFGLVKSCFFRGLDPYEEIVHSIATREVIVRSSKGLAEPGTLFKNLMAILRDVVICYDGSVRNISSNSIIQFEYGIGGLTSQCLFPAGEPVGVLAATAMSNPAYKAVLDSSPNSNSSWDMMKEILFCRVNFKNDLNDRRVILYLNDCDCGRRNCQERASYLVKNHLQKVSLRDAALEFLIEYKHSKIEPGTADIDTGLVGHIHLNKTRLNEAGISMDDILQKCEDGVNSLRRKKKYGYHFRKIDLSVCDCCLFQHVSSKWSRMPCLKFSWQDMSDAHLEKASHIMADLICPVLLDTIVKGDPRISMVNIVWISSDSVSWVRNPLSNAKGELGVEVTLEKSAVRQNGDAWRIILDCCLPVFHFIDTRRSIPYAIKQIQDLFGISCVFDQVVQRLSTSVSMVTKGVLKEHLLLLASSMTCTGNLIGFNMSGIKALCRALNVQVPFTEATLYTPRKCFERASEKCHVDSLASIVGSCSWGKRVAVGTGAKFDLLWDTKETSTGDYPVDVYNFLQLVRSSNEDEIDAGYLGEDIDQFDWEDAFMEPAMSPEQENKAVFDDNIEIGLDSQAVIGGESSWDVAGGNSGKSEDGGWSSWGQKKDQSQPEQMSNVGGWDAPKSNAAESSSSWGKAVKETENRGSGNEGGGWSNWGPKKDQSQPEGMSNSGGWNASKPNAAESSPGWGKAVQQTGNTGSGKAESGGLADWGAKKDHSQPEQLPKSGGWGALKSTNGPHATEPSSAWGKAVKETNNAEPSSAWGKPVKVADNDGTQNNDSGWGNKAAKKTDILPSSGSCGQTEDGQQGVSTNSWKKDGTSERGWGTNDGKQQATCNSGAEFNKSASSGGWDSAVNDKSAVASQWGQKQENKHESNDSHKEDGKKQSWGQPGSSVWKNNSNESSSGWSSDKLNDEAGGWGSSKANQQAGSGSWDNSEKKENKRQHSWGQQSGFSQKSYLEMASQSWKSQKEENNAQSSWGQSTNSNWKNNDKSAGSWKAGKANRPAGSKPWQSSTEENRTPSSWGQASGTSWSSGGTNEEAGTKNWGSKKEDSKPNSWGKPSETSGNNSIQDAGGWNSEKTNEGADNKSWDSKKEESITLSWRKPTETAWNKSTQNAGGWNSAKTNEGADSKSWNSKKEESKTPSTWGKPSETASTQGSGGWNSGKINDEVGSGGWDSKKKESESQSSWGKSSDTEKPNEEISGDWDSKQKESKSQPSWGQPSDEPQTPGESQGWDSPRANTGNEGWKRKRPEGAGGRGWGSGSGEWKSKRNRPPKQSGPNDDSNPVALTATRKRMDMFTPEEQDVLTDIEGIMQSIRRIMHQTGFNDGDPIPADDQTYIINNVLDHHPDKAAKIGVGVDYITVKKHSNFQESRCFYVVSTDGRTEDFSYIKCLGNMIKGKYPSVAESFTAKYFGRPRGGGGGGRNRQHQQEESGGGGENQQDSSGV